MVYFEETTMVRKYWLILSFMLVAVMTPSLSNATCTISGVVVRVTAYDDLYSTLGSYIYFRTSSLSPYYYYVSTNDDEMTSNAIAYMNSGRTATIQGNIATCPAVPAAGGAASLGSLNYFYNP
jgi:hypothetical protein